MFTEVQVSNNRSHMIYLQMIMSKVAGSAGICRKDIEDMEKALLEVCSTALKNASESGDGKLSVRLSSGPDSVVADVVDRWACGEQGSHAWFDELGYSRGLESIAHLVDTLELTRGSDEITVRLAKYAVRSTSSMIGVGQLAAVVGPSLQT